MMIVTLEEDVEKDVDEEDAEKDVDVEKVEEDAEKVEEDVDAEKVEEDVETGEMAVEEDRLAEDRLAEEDPEAVAPRNRRASMSKMRVLFLHYRKLRFKKIKIFVSVVRSSTSTVLCTGC
jgi:hypothetical protein